MVPNPLGFWRRWGPTGFRVHAWPDTPPRMGWSRYEGSWRPVLHFETELNEQKISSRLHQTLQTLKDNPAFGFADNLSVSPETFREEARTATTHAKPHDRAHADFLAAFGTDIIADEQTGNILDTAFANHERRWTSTFSRHHPAFGRGYGRGADPQNPFHHLAV